MVLGQSSDAIVSCPAQPPYCVVAMQHANYRMHALSTHVRVGDESGPELKIDTLGPYPSSSLVSLLYIQPHNFNVVIVDKFT